MRDRVGHRRPVGVRDLRRHRAGRAAPHLERLCVNKVDVAPGRTVYTPLLNAAGGILADLTIMRLAHDRFRVVTGGGMGMRDKKIFTDALPADGSAQLHDATNAVHDVRAVGAAGARRPRRGRRRRHDISHAGFPFLTLEDGRHRRRPDAGLADQLRRRARLGDLRPDRAGPPGLGRALGGRQAARHGAGRDRHVRGDGPAREGLPGPRRRARARLRPRRGGHGPADGQGRRLRRQGGLPPAARRAAGRDPVHADASTTRRRRPASSATCSAASRS